MSNLRQAAQQALEALEDYKHSDDDRVSIAMHILRAALAEPEQKSEPGAWNGWVLREVLFDNGEPIGHREPEQEPVAWGYELATTVGEHGYDGWSRRLTQHKPNVPEGSIRNLTPLYTAPTPRKPLTDEKYNELIMAVGKKYPGETRHETALRYIRQAEASGTEGTYAIKEQET